MMDDDDARTVSLSLIFLCFLYFPQTMFFLSFNNDGGGSSSLTCRHLELTIL